MLANYCAYKICDKSTSLILKNLHFVLEKNLAFKFSVWTLTFSLKDLRSSHKVFSSGVVRKPATCSSVLEALYKKHISRNSEV